MAVLHNNPFNFKQLPHHDYHNINIIKVIEGTYSNHKLTTILILVHHTDNIIVLGISCMLPQVKNGSQETGNKHIIS